jgi:hypothetical protein
VLHVKTDSKSVMSLLGEGMSGNMIKFVRKETNERLVTACEIFDAAIFDNKISVVEKPDGSAASARCIEKLVAKLGRLADMIVVPFLRIFLTF